MTDKLKPCPFCGVMPEVTNGMISHPYAEAKDGACALAGLGISIIHSKWGTEQISAWNARADPWQPIETAPKDVELLLGLALLRATDYETVQAMLDKAQAAWRAYLPLWRNRERAKG